MKKIPSYTDVDSENPGRPDIEITAIARPAARSSNCGCVRFFKSALKNVTR
jgi:hypothetical protein